MEKQIKFQNVVFKFDFKDTDRNGNTTYSFKICDKSTKANVIKLMDEIYDYVKEKNSMAGEYDFNNCLYSVDNGKYKFRVKDKWLTTTNFTNKLFYHGDLNMLFYSIDRPDFSRENRFSIISMRRETEGYYAKLNNVKQIDIEK